MKSNLGIAGNSSSGRVRCANPIASDGEILTGSGFWKRIFDWIRQHFEPRSSFKHEVGSRCSMENLFALRSPTHYALNNDERAN